MTEDTASSYVGDILLPDDAPIWSLANPAIKSSARLQFAPDEDIDLWLKHNAPTTFHQLSDIRYSLYHRCSRAEFTVANTSDHQFDLAGRHSKLRVINDSARHYLLWKLRLLGRKNNWISALPKTRNPRCKSENVTNGRGALP